MSMRTTDGRRFSRIGRKQTVETKEEKPQEEPGGPQSDLQQKSKKIEQQVGKLFEKAKRNKRVWDASSALAQAVKRRKLTEERNILVPGVDGASVVARIQQAQEVQQAQQVEGPLVAQELPDREPPCVGPEEESADVIHKAGPRRGNDKRRRKTGGRGCVVTVRGNGAAIGG